MKNYILIFLLIIVLWFKYNDLFVSKPKLVNNSTKIDERIVSICTFENNGKYSCKNVNMTMEEFKKQRVDENITFIKNKELKQNKLVTIKQKDLNNSIKNNNTKEVNSTIEQDSEENEKNNDEILNFIYENDS